MAIACSQSGIVFPSLNTYEGAYVSNKIYPPASNFYKVSTNPCSTITFGNPTYSNNPICAKKTSSFYDLFYERIWLIPTQVDFTGIEEGSQVPVIVWNSYSTSKLLSDVTITSVGVAQSLANNTTFIAYEAKTSNFSYNSGSGVNLIGTATFNFSNAEDLMVQILGSRIELLMINHNWDSEMTERYSYLTDITECYDGTEQARMIRKYPRRELSYEFLTLNSLDKNEISLYRAYFDNFLSYNQDRVISIPILSDKLLIENTLNTGSNSIVFTKNPLLYDFHVDGNLVIYNSYNNFEVVKIQSINSTTITLAANTTKTWSKGSVVAPIRTAYFASESITYSKTNDILENFSGLSFIINPSEETINPRFTSYIYPYTYKNYPVHIPQHDYTDDKSQEVYKNFNQVGKDFGIILRESRLSSNRKKIPIKYIISNKTDLNKFLGFFDYLKGRLNYVWIPEKDNTFQLASAYTSGQNNIVIKDIGYTNRVNQNKSKRNIIFRHKDGSVYFNKIIDSMNNNNGTETLYLENTFSSNFSTSDFKDISFMYFCRSDSDSLEISYSTQELIFIAHTFTQLTTSPE